MANINVTRLDDAAQADNFRQERFQPDQPIDGQAPWQKVIVVGIVGAGLGIVGITVVSLYRAGVCWSNEFSAECGRAVIAQTIAIWTIPLAALATLALLAWSFIVRQRVAAERAAIIHDSVGIPVSAALVRAKTLEHYKEEQDLHARRLVDMAKAQPYGSGIDSFSPSYHHHHEVNERAASIIDQPEPVGLLPAETAIEDSLLPIEGQSTLARLVEQGFIRFSEYDLLVGAAVNDRGNALPGKPVLLRWSRQRAGNEPVLTAIAGLPGSGKTYLARCLIAQAVMKSITVVICDPNHGSDQGLLAGIDDLEPHLGRPVASTPAEITAAIKWVHGRLAARRAGREANTGVLLVVDEYTSIVVGYGNRDELTDQLIEIGANGRHFAIRGVLIGQAWQGSVVGGDRSGPLRDLISLKLIGTSNPRQLDFLTYGLPTTEKAKLASVASPYMYAYQNGALTKVVIPGMLDSSLVTEVLRYRSQAAPQRSPATPDDDLLSQLLEPGIALESQGNAGNAKERSMGAEWDDDDDGGTPDSASECKGNAGNKKKEGPDLGLAGEVGAKSVPPVPFGSDDPTAMKRSVIRSVLLQGLPGNAARAVVKGKNEEISRLIAEVQAELEEEGLL